MTNIFPIDFEEKLTMAQDDYILFSDSEDWNKIKKAQYKNLKGEKGDPWTPWQDWQDWAAATITVGSVTTWAAWSSATVVNSWTSSAAVLDFSIPQWVAWTPWADGNDWAAATITVGTTTTLPAGSSATVTNVWTSQDAILNFGIPKGDSWTGSWDVTWPASSTDWDVAVFDWATGKLIKDWSVALSTLSSAASLASTAIQPWDDISDLNNDSGFITWINSTDVTTALGYTPYSSSNPDWYLTSSTWVTSVNGNHWAVSLTIPSISTITVTLTSANWSSKTQTVTATGVTASNTVIVSPDPSDISDYSSNWVYCSTQTSWYLTFECAEEPTNNIDVNVVIIS